MTRGRGRPSNKLKNIPTPFGLVDLDRSIEHQSSHIESVPVQSCMFPGCKSKVPARLFACDTPHALEINVAVVDNGQVHNPSSKPLSMRMASCEAHGHVMKARGLKKDMELQQYSHMRNVYTTLHNLVRHSCHDLLQDIGEF